MQHKHAEQREEVAPLVFSKQPFTPPLVPRKM
jgi:hypothetical protein